MIEIKNRYTGEVIKTVDADSLTYAYLSSAYLSSANLRRANLRIANLRHADLRHADLSYADLRHADLTDANLRHANLRDANLTDADLRHAYLSYADLRGVKINWQSHDLLSEILRQSAGEDVQKRMIAGLLLVSRDCCWEQFLAVKISKTLKLWALDTLRSYITDGDNHPVELDYLGLRFDEESL